MQRRHFLTTALGTAAVVPFSSTISLAQENVRQPNLIRPKALSKGDTVGVIASAVAVSDPDQLLAAKRVLDHLGLKMKLGQHVAKGSGYRTRTVEERLSDLHDMFRDPEVKAVLEIEGGYGAAQLLDKIDYGLILNNPKIFAGFSDITALHLAIHKQAGLVTFHGPVVYWAAFSDYTFNHFKKALFETEPLGELANPPEEPGPVKRQHPLRTIRSGKAKGRLVGGNLTLISSQMGTPYEIETKGKILFVEEVEEPFHRIDQMLTHLRLAGKLKEAAGIVVGECADCHRDAMWDLSLGEVLDNLLGNLNIPVFYGLTIGHTDDILTLPLGIEAEMDADKGTVTLLEPAVIR